MLPVLWTPDLKGTSSKPNKGTDPKCDGWYIQDPVTGLVTFGAEIRTGPGSTRGGGVYRATLPLPGICNVDPEGFTRIGGATVGYGMAHKDCGLHFCGVDGYVSTDHAVMTPEGGMFVSAAYPYPGGSIDNIHWNGSYLAALP